VVIIFAFLDLGKNISFSDSLLCTPLGRMTEDELFFGRPLVTPIEEIVL